MQVKRKSTTHKHIDRRALLTLQQLLQPGPACRNLGIDISSQQATLISHRSREQNHIHLPHPPFPLSISTSPTRTTMGPSTEPPRQTWSSHARLIHTRPHPRSPSGQRTRIVLSWSDQVGEYHCQRKPPCFRPKEQCGFLGRSQATAWRRCAGRSERKESSCFDYREPGLRCLL